MSEPNDPVSVLLGAILTVAGGLGYIKIKLPDGGDLSRRMDRLEANDQRQEEKLDRQGGQLDLLVVHLIGDPRDRDPARRAADPGSALVPAARDPGQ